MGVQYRYMEPLCPVCHTAVRPTDYYCFNCGKNLHEKPLEISTIAEYGYYAASVFLPPIGLYWAFRFIKNGDERAKRIGWILIVFTVISTLVASLWVGRMLRAASDQVNQQMQLLEGL